MSRGNTKSSSKTTIACDSAAVIAGSWKNVSLDAGRLVLNVSKLSAWSSPPNLGGELPSGCFAAFVDIVHSFTRSHPWVNLCHDDQALKGRMFIYRTFRP